VWSGKEKDKEGRKERKTCLSYFIERVPDWSRFFEVVDGVECGAENGEPEKKTWKGDREEEEGPCEPD
jgi:hypothetical protein